MDLDEDVDPKPNPATLDFNSTRSAMTPGSQNDGAKPPIRRRAPIACRRCRRLRSKCIHEKASPPCKACEEAGLGPADCVFPARGQPDHDRQYRHPRTRVEKTAKRDPNKVRRDVLDAPISRQPTAPPTWPQPADDWDLLPPLPEVIDAVRLFTRKYFQLGFIPKDLFPQRLHRDHRSVSVFLILSILSISARFSPSLAKRYEGEIKAADYFMEQASGLALRELYQEPTLERCQAFYLLSIAQQGSGYRNKSYINLGIATRLALLMHLHREETYVLSNNATKEEIINAESARRTLWMLHSQDNLHCGTKSPTSLAASDITCLLPCAEEEFADGRQPRYRAALEDTPPARDDERLIHQPNRSLFATLIQAHYYWGKVAREATVSAKSPAPWEDSSDFAVMARKLEVWEQKLPAGHRWNHDLLLEYKEAGEDLAYMNVTMMTKLCNIVLRRPYLDEVIHPNVEDPQRRFFFAHMSDDLFRNVRDLYQQINVHFSAHGKDKSVGAQIASFCVYSCGLFSTYLCKYKKQICSDMSIIREGPNMLQRCMSILIDSKEVWPLASRWLESLEQFSRDPKAAVMSLERGMADGNDRALRSIRTIQTSSFSRDSVIPPLASDLATLGYPSQPSLRRSSHDLHGITNQPSTSQQLPAPRQEQLYYSVQTSQHSQPSYPSQMYPTQHATCAQPQPFPISMLVQPPFDQSNQQHPRPSQQTVQTLQAFSPHPNAVPMTHAANPNSLAISQLQQHGHQYDATPSSWGVPATSTLTTLGPGTDGFETELVKWSGEGAEAGNWATHGVGMISY
ncbi:hypothetical protein SODALDRAFT_343122 [Sodiomyces alkalinus F11]|uniref:Zn(2)-C6 fungal-type domain-containing protein n=1 Tax=Sodiomyces alkalinus (strain CBS 110278 / VKM F-3762 / F11) TaxID=1314773 RepID=A0A3N2Q2B7_SODAK|nr:hypothetical protein SODALDRAFT_343122 [Sodiomyces alkalinus F11]ROT40913.1 hypothetical protein SODALDRAFT_343122 [Sodiomyces alkalinus F11]